MAANHHTRIRFGIIGCGRIATRADQSYARWRNASLWIPYSHASAIAAVPAAELVALCDVDREVLRSACERLNVSRAYTTVEDLLRSERLDVVVIATRTPGRHSVVKQCVASGVRAIICEKPLCNSLKEAVEIREAVLAHNVRFVYGTRRRFMAAYMDVRETAVSGELGELQSITIHFPPGLLLWDHPHTVDLLQFFSQDDEIDFVQASLELSETDEQVVEVDPKVQFGIVRFRSGITGHIVVGGGYDVEINGTMGRMCVRGDGSAIHRRVHRDAPDDYGLMLEETSAPTLSSVSGMERMVDLLCRSLIDGTPIPYDVDMAVQNMRILLGFVQSHRSGGRRVCPKDVPFDLVVMGRTGTRYA